jgi:hypothetical protein
VATKEDPLQSSKVTAKLAAKPTPTFAAAFPFFPSGSDIKHRQEPVSVNEDHDGLPETSEPSAGDKETHATMEEWPSQQSTASTLSAMPVHHLETCTQPMTKSKTTPTIEEEPFSTADSSFTKHGRRAGFTEDDERLLQECFIKELKDECVPTAVVRRKLEACIQLRDIKQRFSTKTIVDKLRCMMRYPRPENSIL